MSFINDNESDNFTTNSDEWKRIKKFIPKNKVIWSPFYCDGKQKEYFAEMGFDIIHEDKDFFTYTPEYDIVIDNIPFSKKREVLKKLKEIDKPFMILCSSVLMISTWFFKMFKEDLQIIIPLKKINCTNLNENKPFNFNWGIYIYCYKMNLPKDIILLN